MYKNNQRPIRFCNKCKDYKKYGAKGLCHNCYEKKRLKEKAVYADCRICANTFRKIRGNKVYCSSKCRRKNHINIQRNYRKNTPIELRRKLHTAWRRKKGVLPRGQSQDEKRFYKQLTQLFNPKEIIWGDWKTLKRNKNPLQLDFHLPKHKIAFEIDGPIHRYNSYGEKRLERQIKTDLFKDKETRKLGIDLVRIYVGNDIGKPIARVPYKLFNKLAKYALKGGVQ
jgi:hypothetical protein